MFYYCFYFCILGHGLVREYVTVRGLKLPKKEGPVQQRMKALLLAKQRGGGGTVAVPMVDVGEGSAGLSSSPSSYAMKEQGLRLPSRVARDGQQQGQGPGNTSSPSSGNNSNPAAADEEDALLQEVDIEGGGGRRANIDPLASDPSAAGGGGSGWSLSLPGLTAPRGGTLWWANNPFGNNSPSGGGEGYTPPANRRTRERGGDRYYDPTNRDAELDTKNLDLNTLLTTKDDSDDVDPNLITHPYGTKFNGMDLDDPLTMSVVVERFIDSVLPGKEFFETGYAAKDGNEDQQDLDRYIEYRNLNPLLILHHINRYPNPHINFILTFTSS